MTSADDIRETARPSAADHVGAVDTAASRAQDALLELTAVGRSGRAAMLRAMAHALEAERAELVAVADAETSLGEERLGNELTRTRHQLELFAEVVSQGDYLDVTIDHSADTPMGRRPDLRRMLAPLGPVAVFGASNFPLAFSVPGGDTASALAAGCSVVVKVHDAHLETSAFAHRALVSGARAAGIDTDVVSLVHGREAGIELVRHPAISAVGFTGSLDAGRVLFDVASARPDPIPFYGELGALNALIVCPQAARNRSDEIAEGLFASFTTGVGQFCTKPGMALLPAGADGDRLRARLAEQVFGQSAGVMLTQRIAAGYARGADVLRHQPGVGVLAEARADKAHERTGTPLLLRADAAALSGPLLDECFGPVLVLVDYPDLAALYAALDVVPPALTASIHADPGDEATAHAALVKLMRKVGRVVWNGYPTGVAVSWAMHHGGPFPATTNALHSSVGPTSVRRWLRPIALQNVPNDLLPDELRDLPRGAPVASRRVDGVMTTSH
jgi:NADP-dependent aldehyde dehydrogenase